MSTPRSTVYVVYVPYLPLTSRVRIGEWDLIPKADLQESDAIDAQVTEWARAVAALYALPEPSREPVGAFGCLVEGHIGDDPADATLMQDLRRAFVMAIIDGNESPLIEPDERDPNSGHWAMSSENAEVVTYGIQEGWTSTITGGRIPRLSIGVPLVSTPGLPATPIQPPTDLLLPSMSRNFDHEYADAVWESMRRGTDDGRRLARAVEWLRLAWLNTSDLTPDLRIPALRGGFEVLLDSEQTKELSHSLVALLDDKSSRILRQWTNTQNGRPTSRELTDLEWWFMRFSLLRHALMHGREPNRGDWTHNGALHVDLGSGYLAYAIKKIVINDGHADIQDDVLWRQAIRETRARLHDEGDVKP